MKRSLLVAKDVNYGASVGSATVNTALTPDQLAAGALGIYCIDPSDNKIKLVTDGNTGTGLITAAAAATAGIKEFTPYVGTSSGIPYKGPVFNVNGTTVKPSHYIAPVKQVFAVGYTNSTTSGSLNMPSTIYRGDEAMIKIKDSSVVDEIDRLGDNYTAYADQDSPDKYDILKNLFDNLNEDNNRKVNMEIYSNGTGTAFVAGTHFTGSGTAQIAVTNGSKEIVISATSLTAWDSATYGAGTKVFIKGALYEIASVGTPASNAVTITLDREFQGATATATNVSTTDGASVASITQYGFKLTDKDFELFNQFTFTGLFSSATTSVVTEPVPGNGTPTKLTVKEKQTWDRVDRVDRRWNLPDSQVDSTVNYDQYVFDISNSIVNNDGSGYAKNSKANLNIACVTGIADTPGKNQSDLEDILASLGLAFTGIV